jgi:hypothetical protein
MTEGDIKYVVVRVDGPGKEIPVRVGDTLKKAGDFVDAALKAKPKEEEYPQFKFWEVIAL